jgi:hypothetical protein
MNSLNRDLGRDLRHFGCSGFPVENLAVAELILFITKITKPTNVAEIFAVNFVCFALPYREHLTLGSKLYLDCLSADPKRLYRSGSRPLIFPVAGACPLSAK